MKIAVWVFKLAKDYFMRWQKLNRRLDSIESSIKHNHIATKRLELLHAFVNTPNEVVLIMMLYDEYKVLGGNSYIDEAFKEWHKIYCKGCKK